jgi:hypothetical protein
MCYNKTKPKQTQNKPKQTQNKPCPERIYTELCRSSRMGQNEPYPQLAETLSAAEGSIESVSNPLFQALFGFHFSFPRL